MASANAILARLGGDEFAVCIVDHAGPTPTTAQQFAEDVRRYTPGTSIGIASHSGENAEISPLCAAADADLYTAKQYRSTGTRDPGLG